MSLPRVNAGRLRHRLRIELPVFTTADDGSEYVEFEHEAYRWGRVDPLSTRERLVAEQVDSDVTHRITMRTYDGLTVDHRIVTNAGNRIFHVSQIRNIDDVDRRTELLCIERTGVDDG